ncbi:HK97 family phage prohead protease [Streptomyces sp. NPDC015131]|uniref:HK97 family phage prohead protease n=1 Tax=Streptomyces sp. NPDC015131 TaxID=3364941 RepID=UPI0036F7FB22
MERKALDRVELKDADQGVVVAVFSTFDTVDLDDDVVTKDAFKGKDGQPVRISAYNHASWQGALPVGKGVVRVTDREAVCEMQFNMKTQAGRETFETIKQMGELQEYSWGFNVVESEREEREGKQVRVIKAVDIFEVSPVLLGAGGPGRTGTLAVKSKAEDDEDAPRRFYPAVKRALPVHETAVAAMPWNGTATVKALPDDARPSELRSVYAWVDPDGDPEMKTSYRFPHHHGVGGPANIRACLQGIAVLNGAKGASVIPEGDRKAVYEHLASHLRDADREPPMLRTAGDGQKNLRFNDEATEVLARVSNLIDRATEVVALRAQKGRGMSPAMVDLLSWLEDDVTRLKSLLEHPVEDEKQLQVEEALTASTLMAALARVNEL